MCPTSLIVQIGNASNSRSQMVCSYHWRAYRYLKRLAVLLLMVWLLFRPGPRLNIKTVFLRYGIPMLKIRRSWGRLIFNMGIPILVIRHLYIETAPRSFLWHTCWLIPILIRPKWYETEMSSCRLIYRNGWLWKLSCSQPSTPTLTKKNSASLIKMRPSLLVQKWWLWFTVGSIGNELEIRGCCAI